jgi:hypothetical protein
VKDAVAHPLYWGVTYPTTAPRPSNAGTLCAAWWVSNIAKLRDVFQDISFNSNKLGDEEQKNDILRHLL